MSSDEAQLVDAEIMKQREMLKQEWKSLEYYYSMIDLWSCTLFLDLV